MERRVILFTTIAALGGILFLVGYNNRGEEEAEKATKADKVTSTSSQEAKQTTQTETSLSPLVGPSDMFTAVVSEHGSALKSVILHDDQYIQPDRTDGAKEYIPKERLDEGPYEIVSTWQPRYYPFRVLIKEARWDQGGGDITLLVNQDSKYELVKGNRSQITLTGPTDKAGYSVQPNDIIVGKGLAETTVIRATGSVIQLSRALPEKAPSTLKIVRKGSPKRLFSDDPATSPKFLKVSDDKGKQTYVWPNPERDESSLWIQRSWTISGDYKLDHVTQFFNLGSSTLTLRYSLNVYAWEDPHKEEASMFTMPPTPWTPVCYVDESYEQGLATDLAETDGFTVLNGRVNWFGVTSQYFVMVGAFSSPTGLSGACTLQANPNGVVSTAFERSSEEVLPGTENACLPKWFPIEKRPGSVRCTEAMERLSVDEKHLDEASLDIALDGYKGPRSEAINYRKMLLVYGASRDKGSIKFTVFAGPKDLDLLREASPSLESALDFGWFRLLAVPLLSMMKLFYVWVGNWAIAIVLLTILIRLLMFPLTQKSFVQMQKMQVLKPEMDEVQKKYQNDKERLHKEMMNLYKRHGVNPLGGCLPMMLQMPVWFALYRMIYNAVDLYQAPLFLWIQDMTQPDPYYILPLMLGVFFYVQQLFTPVSPSADATQQKIMRYFMPIMFSGMMLFLPAGLVFYIFISTLFGIGQQWVIRRKYAPATNTNGGK